MGMRLVKKTINQDDISTYHLFFADDMGNPGTDLTFFDFPGINKVVKGSDEISRIGLRVKSDEALSYWKQRFEKHKIKHQDIKEMFGRRTIFFEDFDTQEYAIFSDEGIFGVEAGIPWKKGPIPDEYAIIGLGPIFFRITDINRVTKVLTENLDMRYSNKENDFHLFEMNKGGNGASVIVEESSLARGHMGYGGVHHVAFRVEEKVDINEWIVYLNEIFANHSGFVDRFYFKSLYTRLYPGLLFEFATEGPGFIDDEETYEILGETLALPPKFRNQRKQIEKYVRQIDTVRSNRTFVKEYN
jgi:glyoxalase family protein